MYSRPWKMLVLAFCALLVPFIFSVAIDQLAALLDKLQPKTHHFTDVKLGLQLVTLISGGFGGALIGAAVFSRALILHNAEVAKLRASVDSLEKEYRELEAKRKRITVQQSILPENEYQQELRAVDRLIIERRLQLREVKDRLRKYVV